MKYSKDVKKALVVVIPICIVLSVLFTFIIANVVDLEDYLKENYVKAVLKTEEAKNNQTQLLLDLGLSYDFQGNSDKAIEAYKYAIENDPEATLPWHRLSLLYVEAGNFDEALFAREKVVELAPEESVSYSYYAPILLLYDVKEALLAIDKFYDLAIKDGEVDAGYVENVNMVYESFEEEYTKGDFYSAYTKLFNSEIYIDNHIEVEILTRLIESGILSPLELKEIEEMKANIEEAIAEGVLF